MRLIEHDQDNPTFIPREQEVLALEEQLVKVEPSAIKMRPLVLVSTDVCAARKTTYIGLRFPDPVVRAFPQQNTWRQRRDWLARGGKVLKLKGTWRTLVRGERNPQ